jgi:hypothetical protein
MSAHHIAPGDFFTPEQWNGPLVRHISALIEKPGGVLLISVEVAPERRSYPEVRFAVFDAVERKALRAALLKAKKKREAGNHRQATHVRARKAPAL